LFDPLGVGGGHLIQKKGLKSGIYVLPKPEEGCRPNEEVKITPMSSVSPSAPVDAWMVSPREFSFLIPISEAWATNII
jgi:hypothetical protein